MAEDPSKKTNENLLSKIPFPILIVLLILIFLIAISFKSQPPSTEVTQDGTVVKQTAQPNWLLIAVIVIIVVYILSQKAKSPDVIYLPREAKQLIADEIIYMKGKGEVDFYADIQVGPEIRRIYNKAAADDEYVIRVTTKDMDSKVTEYSGYHPIRPPSIPQLVREPWRVRGTEIPDQVTIIPEILKYRKQFGNAFDVLLRNR